ncbi:serine-rich adhesin for platelets-like isoform X2 [Heptranchias perlo]|uniref:serine-rich adhesin for platelets-like isoform X2 n=1 Tax=Heptranchias perlo TaxID=212740 RepID=UPI00355A6A0F
MKKMKATCNVQEILPHPHCPSFTSKVHATLIAPNLDLCSCISRSCTVNLNSDASNVDSHADFACFPQCSPKCASENNTTINSTNIDLCSHTAYSSLSNSQCASKMDAASKADDVGSCSYATNSSKCSEQFTSKIDVTSNASSMDFCESISNSNHHNPQYGNETQANTNNNLPLMCSSKSDESISSGGFHCVCLKTHEFKDTNSTHCNLVGIDPCSNVSNIPTESECNDNSQESDTCQSPPEITNFICISENTQAIPTWQSHQLCSYESLISGDVFTADLSQKGAYSSNGISSPKTANRKHPNDHGNAALLKDHTFRSLSEQMPDSDTGISSSYNSSCLSLEREGGENIAPFYQFCVPCTSTNAGPSQTDCIKNGSEHLCKSTCSNGEKSIPSNCFVIDGLSKSQVSNNTCNTFSGVRPHGDIGSNLCCKSLNLSSERKCFEKITHSCQHHQQCSSDGYKMDCSKQEMHCLLQTTSYSAESASFDNGDISNPLGFWNTNNVVHNTKARCNFGDRPSCRNPKLLSKRKSCIRSNPKTQTGCNVQFAQSNLCQSQSTTNFEVNSNTSSRDSTKKRTFYLPTMPSYNSAKSNSSNHFYSIGFPKSRTLRNGHRTCSKLRPRNGIHIRTVHKNQRHAYTSKKNITINQENDDLGQISAQSFPNEPMNALKQELPEAPTIYKHTVAGTSAKVRWMFGVEERIAYFFELQFQEIISIDKEMAIPRDQAGVFSGIRHKNFVATNLNSNSEYLFRVRAVNVAGKGPWSQPYKILTVHGTEQRDIDTKEEVVSLKGVKVTIRRSS